MLRSAPETNRFRSLRRSRLQRRPHRLVLELRLCGLSLWLSLPLLASAQERIDLRPDRSPPWRASRLLPSLRQGARDPRAVRIETEPKGARLEVALVRGGTELRRGEGLAPLTIVVPGFALWDPRDRVVVRARARGYAGRELGGRLAALSLEGRVELHDGFRLPIAAALERARILTQPAEVRGLLAAIRALTRALAAADEAEHALHAWLAPESSAAAAAALSSAGKAEAACRSAP